MKDGGKRMNVTINDAINAFNLLREHVNENGFLHECYNLGISALKTVQDGDYHLPSMNVPRETLIKMAEYDCGGLSCSDCRFWCEDSEGYRVCFALKARDILRAEQYIKEVSEWVKQNEKNS